MSITLLLAFERSGKALKGLEVKGWRAEFKGSGQGRECGKSEKKWYDRRTEGRKSQKLHPHLGTRKYQGCGPRRLGV